MQAELLDEAPQLLAVEPATPARPDQARSLLAASSDEYLTFRLGTEEYAIDILRVQEIRGVVTATRIAQAAPTISGVVNLRGVIVPIVDLRLAFGLPAVNDSATVTIILTIAERVIGVTVDAVADVVTISAANILPPPEFSASETGDAIVGLASLGDGDARRTLIVTDIQRLMSGPQMGLF